MKKPLLVAGLIGTAICVHATGYFNFDNSAAYTGALNPYLTTISADSNPGEGTPVSAVGSDSTFATPNYDVSFLWLDGTTFSGQQLAPGQFMAAGAVPGGLQTSYIANTGDITDGAGLFSGGEASIPRAVDGQNITVQEIAWYNPNGTTSFSQAQALGYNTGWSVTTTVRLVSGTDLNFADLSSVPGFTVGPVPEPSLMTLSTLSVTAFAISRRRKK